jgi:hypothetical protein
MNCLPITALLLGNAAPQSNGEVQMCTRQLHLLTQVWVASLCIFDTYREGWITPWGHWGLFAPRWSILCRERLIPCLAWHWALWGLWRSGGTNWGKMETDNLSRWSLFTSRGWDVPWRRHNLNRTSWSLAPGVPKVSCVSSLYLDGTGRTVHIKSSCLSPLANQTCLEKQGLWQHISCYLTVSYKETGTPVNYFLAVLCTQ